jgi:hypothetical protein
MGLEISDDLERKFGWKKDPFLDFEIKLFFHNFLLGCYEAKRGDVYSQAVKDRKKILTMSLKVGSA